MAFPVFLRGSLILSDFRALSICDPCFLKKNKLMFAEPVMAKIRDSCVFGVYKNYDCLPKSINITVYCSISIYNII